MFLEGRCSFLCSGRICVQSAAVRLSEIRFRGSCVRIRWWASRLLRTPTVRFLFLVFCFYKLDLPLLCFGAVTPVFFSSKLTVVSPPVVSPFGMYLNWLSLLRRAQTHGLSPISLSLGPCFFLSAFLFFFFFFILFPAHLRIIASLSLRSSISVPEMIANRAA